MMPVSPCAGCAQPLPAIGQLGPSNRIGLRSLVTLNPGRPQPYHAPIASHGGAAVSPMVFDLMPAACSSVPPLDGSQQASHRTALGGIVSTAEPLIRLPVHAFRFVGEPFQHDRPPS